MAAKQTIAAETSHTAENDNVLRANSITTSKAFLTHAICGLGLVSALYAAHHVFSINLIDHPAQTLRLIWVVEAPMVILVYSFLRHDPNQYSFLTAVGQGLLGLPAGAVVNALGAIALGAPMIQNFQRTLHWSLLMSVLTCVPVASLYGFSWADWHRMFAQTKPSEPLEFMICLPAHGAIIGAWFGAWPMPLDWERPWQEWPICVTYGAIAGYFLGMVASVGFILFHKSRGHEKRD